MSELESITDVSEVLGALDAGLLESKIGCALSEIARATCALYDESQGKAKGSIVLKLTVSAQCAIEGILDISHELKKTVPTKNDGEDTSKIKGRSLMYVQRGGKIVETQPPENLRGQFLMPFEEE